MSMMNPQKVVITLVSLVIVFLLAAELIPEAQTAGDTLNETGVTFGSFFASDGLVFTLIMVGILLAVLYATGIGGIGKKR